MSKGFFKAGCCLLTAALLLCSAAPASAASRYQETLEKARKIAAEQSGETRPSPGGAEEYESEAKKELAWANRHQKAGEEKLAKARRECAAALRVIAEGMEKGDDKKVLEGKRLFRDKRHVVDELLKEKRWRESSSEESGGSDR